VREQATSTTLSLRLFEEKEEDFETEVALA
jgi:hypothetical protein